MREKRDEEWRGLGMKRTRWKRNDVDMGRTERKRGKVERMEYVCIFVY